MNSAIKVLKENNLYQTGQELCSKELILTQKILKKDMGLFMPDAYVEFLHSYNGFCFDGGHVFGIYDENALIDNIIIENKRLDFKEKIALGYDEFSYLTYNCKTSIYQIIDKYDQEVLEEYDNFDEAFFYIVKI